MILRSWNRVRPRSLTDFACFLLVAVFVPVTYIYQITVVLPELLEIGNLGIQEKEILGFSLCIFGFFLFFNVTANMIVCMLVDTTIRIELLKPPLSPAMRRSWHKCEDCQAALVPPRSSHCDTCKICVLKRENHCRFIGCCIGHYNYRYFFFFLVYLAIGSLISFIMGSVYVWHLHFDFYWRPYTLLTVLAPAVSLAIDASLMNFFFLIYELSLLAFCIAVLLLVYHSDIFQRGAVIKERGTNRWNLGLYTNIKMVLGTRMYLTWLSPFIRSDLPHNGINWEDKED